MAKGKLSKKDKKYKKLKQQQDTALQQQPAVQQQQDIVSQQNIELVTPSEAKDMNLEQKYNNMSKMSKADIDKILDSMHVLWKDVKDLFHSTEKYPVGPNHLMFREMTDTQKMNIFNEVPDYKLLIDEFPTVTRYMICEGTYKRKIFERLLVKMSKVTPPPKEKREKNWFEDQFHRRQADYVRYLWEEKYGPHYNQAEAKYIWENAYNTVRGEFDDIKDKHKAAEQVVKENDKKYNAELAYELLERVTTGEQKLPEENKVEMLNMLRDLVWKTRFNKVMTQLLDVFDKELSTSPTLVKGHDIGNPIKCVYILHEYQGMGKGPTEQKPVIKMVEYVDEEHIAEVPRHMLMTEEELGELNKFK